MSCSNVWKAKGGISHIISTTWLCTAVVWPQFTGEQGGTSCTALSTAWRGRSPPYISDEPRQSDWFWWRKDRLQGTTQFRPAKHCHSAISHLLPNPFTFLQPWHFPPSARHHEPALPSQDELIQTRAHFTQASDQPTGQLIMDRKPPSKLPVHCASKEI